MVTKHLFKNNFLLTLVEPHVHPHMGATLEPRPGVRMQVQRQPYRL